MEIDLDNEQINRGIDDLVNEGVISSSNLNNWLISKKIYYNILIINVNDKQDRLTYTSEFSSQITLTDLQPDTKYKYILLYNIFYFNILFIYIINYSIYLQLSTNVNHSHYSKPITIKTLPLPPSPVVVVDINSNEVHLKWYYGIFNINKYRRSK